MLLRQKIYIYDGCDVPSGDEDADEGCSKAGVRKLVHNSSYRDKTKLNDCEMPGKTMMLVIVLLGRVFVSKSTI